MTDLENRIATIETARNDRLSLTSLPLIDLLETDLSPPSPVSSDGASSTTVRPTIPVTTPANRTEDQEPAENHESHRSSSRPSFGYRRLGCTSEGEDVVIDNKEMNKIGNSSKTKM